MNSESSSSQAWSMAHAYMDCAPPARKRRPSRANRLASGTQAMYACASSSGQTRTNCQPGWGRGGRDPAAAPTVFTAALGRDVLQRLGLCERTQLLQALVLDLPNPLSRDVEGPPHLVQRPRMLTVEPVAELEHAAFARREAAEHSPERRFAELLVGDLVRQCL